MSEKSFRIRNQFNNILISYFRQNKGKIILLCIIFIISLITGILTCIEYSDAVTCENLIDKYLCLANKLGINIIRERINI